MHVSLWCSESNNSLSSQRRTENMWSCPLTHNKVREQNSSKPNEKIEVWRQLFWNISENMLNSQDSIYFKVCHYNFAWEFLMSIFLSLSERSIMIGSAEGNMLTCLRAKTNVKNEAENSRLWRKHQKVLGGTQHCTSRIQRCVRRRLYHGTHCKLFWEGGKKGTSFLL